MKETLKRTEKRSSGNVSHLGIPFFVVFALVFCLLPFAGCGTTKWSDTTRTGTEQLLITSAMEDVVDEFDFYPLSGRRVYIKKEGVTCSDSAYLFALLRQQMAANGVFIRDKEDDADYIVEVAPGAVGTNRYELMYGIKQTEVPTALTGGVGGTIPEVSLIKRTDQKAEVKVALWAYNKKTGAIIWQSGTKQKTAYVRDRWFLGIGPISKSSYRTKISVSGDEVDLKKKKGHSEYIADNEKPSVRSEAVYREIDQQSLERLEEIRRESSYRFTQLEEETQKAQSKENAPASAESNPNKTAATPVTDATSKK